MFFKLCNDSFIRFYSRLYFIGHKEVESLKDIMVLYLVKISLGIYIFDPRRINLSFIIESCLFLLICLLTALSDIILPD